MSETINNEIIAGFQKGDPAAFNQVFKAYYRPLCYFCYKLIGNTAESEDIVQIAFYQLHKRCQHFNAGKDIRAFLYMSARNACLNALRNAQRANARHKVFTAHAMDDSELEYEEWRGEILRRIHQAVDNLPGTCKKVFKMLYYEEREPKEIAEKLNITVATVYSQKRHAVQLLKTALADIPPVFFLLLNAYITKSLLL